MKSISFIFWVLFLSTRSRGYIRCANGIHTCKALLSAWPALSGTGAACVILPEGSAELSLSSICSICLRETAYAM